MSVVRVVRWVAFPGFLSARYFLTRAQARAFVRKSKAPHCVKKRLFGDARDNDRDGRDGHGEGF